VQKGLSFVQKNKLPEALIMFEAVIKNDPENDEAKKYAGIVSLRLKNYDKALEYFSILANDTELRSNYGKFYKAVTLLERNAPGDEASARLLLQQVRDENLEGKNKAEEWLQKF
ncbi:MAG: tetratricopeptide repeat protein, partial [Ferruginibacter sp.]